MNKRRWPGRLGIESLEVLCGRWAEWRPEIQISRPKYHHGHMCLDVWMRVDQHTVCVTFIDKTMEETPLLPEMVFNHLDAAADGLLDTWDKNVDNRNPAAGVAADTEESV